MKMNYDGTLTMPSNYAAVTNEEMTYVDGGIQYNRKNWGVEIVMSRAESQRAQNYIAAYGGGLTVSGMFAGAFGPVGWVATAVCGGISLYWGLVAYKLSNKTTSKGVILNIHNWDTFGVNGR